MDCGAKVRQTIIIATAVISTCQILVFFHRRLLSEHLDTLSIMAAFKMKMVSLVVNVSVTSCWREVGQLKLIGEW